MEHGSGKQIKFGKIIGFIIQTSKIIYKKDIGFAYSNVRIYIFITYCFKWNIEILTQIIIPNIIIDMILDLIS